MNLSTVKLSEVGKAMGIVDAEKRSRCYVATVMLLCAISPVASAQVGKPVKVSVDWTKTLTVSRTTPTLMVQVHPLLRRGSAIHETAFNAIKGLGAHYVRYHGQSFWPRLVVAELEPPTEQKTSWDLLQPPLNPR